MSDYATENNALNEWADPQPITTKQMQTIAAIILNWGQADSLITIATRSLFSIEFEDAKLLITPLDARKKLDLIKKKTTGTSVERDVRPILKLINECSQRWKSERDLIAHGMVMADGHGNRSFYSEKSAVEVGMDELPRLLERSRYASDLAHCLIRAVRGQPCAFPDKPD